MRPPQRGAVFSDLECPFHTDGHSSGHKPTTMAASFVLRLLSGFAVRSWVLLARLMPHRPLHACLLVDAGGRSASVRDRELILVTIRPVPELRRRLVTANVSPELSTPPPCCHHSGGNVSDNASRNRSPPGTRPCRLASRGALLDRGRTAGCVRRCRAANTVATQFDRGANSTSTPERSRRLTRPR